MAKLTRGEQLERVLVATSKGESIGQRATRVLARGGGGHRLAEQLLPFGLAVE